MKANNRYSKDWTSSIGTDPFKIFGIVWFDKCASLVKVTSDVVKAFDLGILASRFDEVWYLRRVEYMNDHGDFNFTLTPAEILTNENLKRQEIGYFEDFMTFDMINQAVEDWLDLNYPNAVISN